MNVYARFDEIQSMKIVRKQNITDGQGGNIIPAHKQFAGGWGVCIITISWVKVQKFQNPETYCS